MSKLLKYLTAFFTIIIAIIAIAFAFIELRLVISLDWAIYEFSFNGFLRYFCRFILAIYVLTVAIIYFLRNKNNILTQIFNVSLVNLLIIGIFALFLTTNYVNIAIFVLSIIYVLLNFIQIKINSRKDN